MELLEGLELSKLCDYSFGDQSGSFDNIYSSFMKEANLFNTEFRNIVYKIKERRRYMTLFIDNIRLYKRKIKDLKPQDETYVNSLMKKNNLLELCSFFPEMQFIIFTNLEDTSVDNHIHSLIPENVICIYAVNAISFGEKVVPIFYGLKRKINPEDKNIKYLKNFMNNKLIPSKLLYINHNEKTHKDRVGIKTFFKKKSWASVENRRINYNKFLKNISTHKFVICPRGNAIDCHRNLEVIYLRRVPVMKKNKYLMKLYSEIPVLWVDKYTNLTEELLISKNFLFEQAQKINLNKYFLPNYFNELVNDAIRES